MEVVVFGAGSLGSLIGGVLAREHAVTLVGRDPHMSTVERDGLCVTGAESFVSHPAATTDGEGLGAELAVVTVKAYDTRDAAAALATGSYEAVLSLQNGMGNEAVLADHLEVPVIAGVTSHGALLREPGQVDWTGRGEIALGAWRPRETPHLARIVDVLADTGLEPRVPEDIRAELWRKLAVNTAINPVTAMARVRNGAVQAGSAGELAGDAARETAHTATAEGVELDPAAVVDRTRSVAEATADNRSSMLEDVLAGQRTEIDQLNGYVVDRAAENGLTVPVNQALTTLVRTWEAGQDLR